MIIAFATVVVSEIADFMPRIKRVLGKLLKKIPMAVVTPLKGKTVVRLAQVIREAPAEPVMVSRTMDDPMSMMYTGGTIGPSKGAVLTQGNYMANRRQVLTWLDIRAEDVARRGKNPQARNPEDVERKAVNCYHFRSAGGSMDSRYSMDLESMSRMRSVEYKGPFPIPGHWQRAFSHCSTDRIWLNQKG